MAVSFSNGSNRGHHVSSGVMHRDIAEDLGRDLSGHDATPPPNPTQDHGTSDIANALSSGAGCHPTFPGSQLQTDQSFGDAPSLTVAHECVRMASTQMTNQVTPH